MNRPEQCVKVLERIFETGCSTPGVIVINGREFVQGYTEALGAAPFLPEKWEVICNEENIGFIGTLNKVFKENPNEEFYGFIADDEFVNTEGWDGPLIEAAGDWDISHGNDSIQNGSRFQSYTCIGGKLARAVGFLALPECYHWYGFDTFWEAFSKSGGCERKYIGSIHVDHRHPLAGKGQMDACYADGEKHKHVDQQVYFHWLRTGMADTITRVRSARYGDE